MKGFSQTGPGTESEKLVFHTDLPKPELRPRDLLIRLKGASTNPVDGKVLKRNAKTVTVGFDGAGVVEAVGPEAKGFSVGDAVWFAGDISRNGCFAELVAVDHRIVSLKPRTVDFVTAAAVPLCALTAYEALVESAGLTTSTKNGSILVVAGAGGVGSLVIQLAKKVLGFERVVATASRPETREFCKKLGADATIDHKGDLKAQLAEVGLPSGVDVVYNCAEADENFEQVAAVIRPRGKLILITGLSRPVDITPMFGRRISIIWELMFSRILQDDEPQKQGEVLALFARLVDSGVIDCRVTSKFTAAEIPKAIASQLSGKVIGKNVIDMTVW